MTAIPSLSRVTAHGQRDTAGLLPAGGAACPVSSPGQAATDIPMHPEGRHYGIAGPEWIADQLRRGDGDTRPVPRSQPVDYDLPHYADMRDGGLMPREPMTWREAILWGLMLGAGLTFWMLAGPVAIRAIGAAVMWIAGWW